MPDPGAIFAQHRDALERFACRITGDREDARDLVADAFAALLEAGPGDDGHAVAWLYLTVRHRAYNRVRDRARARQRLPQLAMEANAARRPEPVLRHDARVDALLATAAANLSERDRLAVRLRHQLEAPYEDVAAALGTTPAQARVVVHRATARLRRHVLATLSRGRAGPDELAALRDVPVLVPLREWWRRVQAGGVRAATYVGEALAPVGALVAMTAAAAAAVPTAAAVPASGARVPAVLSAAPASPEAAARPTVSPTPSAVADAVRGPRPALRTTVGSPLAADDPGTTPAFTASVREQQRSVQRVLGLPLDLPDPLDVPKGPDVDIRSVELATTSGADGRASGLRWRITFAAPPLDGVGVSLGWGYADSACSSSIGWPSYPEVVTSCPTQRVGTLDLLWEGKERVRADLRVDGTVLEIVVPFGAFVRPGAPLVRIVAGASCDLLRDSCENWDRAPDSGDGYTYRVEE